MTSKLNLPASFSLALTLLLAGVSPVPAQTQSLRVFNAASFSSDSVAPGSIITIFGQNFTNATAAVTDPSNPPTTLGGVTVTIGGSVAALFYVSPNQINAVVAAATPLGTEAVVVTSSTGTVNGTVVVSATAAPGLFSLTGTGSNDGAIVDALTGRIGAFSVTSGTSATFLALFLTGANFTTPPVVTIGGVNATVTFAGASPCCAGLQQINISLPASLAGAGRVPVMVQAGGQLSNVVEIVLLPRRGEGEFDDDQDNVTRSRELSAVAYVPGTSLALVADENDDVVREVDIAAKKVVHTISLAAGAGPAAIAVDATGTFAIVAERGLGKAAFVSLTSFMVTDQVATSGGPIAVAIMGNRAVVVNGDANSVTFLDTTARTALSTVTVGNGPRGVAIDAAGHVYVTNQGAGTITVMDLATATVLTTLNLGSTRPSAIQIVAGTGFAVVTDPATTADGKVLVVNLVTGAVTSFNVNPAHSGGSNDLVVIGTTAYIANQTAGSISILPLVITGSTVTGTVTTVQVGQGIRSLAFDSKDSLLLAVNEAGGKIVLIGIPSATVVGTINAVVAESGEGDDDHDNHSDHDHAGNLPTLLSVSPINGRANTTFVFTATGTNLGGAAALVFTAANVDGDNGVGRGSGNEGHIIASGDSSFRVSGLVVNSAGTQLTANVTLAASAQTGVRLVRIVTPNGVTSSKITTASTFTVIP